MSNEKPRTLVQQAAIEKSRAEEVLRASESLRIGNPAQVLNDESVMNNLHDAAEDEEYKRKFGMYRREHLQQLKKDKRRTETSVLWNHLKQRGLLRDIDTDFKGDVGEKMLEAVRWGNDRLRVKNVGSIKYAVFGDNTLVQVTEKDPYYVDESYEAIKNMIDSGVLSEDHPERYLFSAYDSLQMPGVYINLGPSTGFETAAEQVKRVLKWDVVSSD